MIEQTLINLITQKQTISVINQMENVHIHCATLQYEFTHSYIFVCVWDLLLLLKMCVFQIKHHNTVDV